MPCRDDWDSADQLAEYQRKVDRLTRMLCGLCKEVDAVQDAELSMELIDRVPNLRKWWKGHQAADRKREARERAERERGRKIGIALAKLTDEERELLGIPNTL